jgi:hypothetical protein
LLKLLEVEQFTSKPVITDGSDYGHCDGGNRMGSVGIDSKPINKNTLQKFLRDVDISKWFDASIDEAADCDGLVSFQSASRS